ncbi:interferon-induced very large GTPase 1-like [Antedon mediterranea]|uniref:interferon-induced very large GTPase 1-like n=1 Tax=Antedon mediterranea TaxID=105859 RepID=UPI003AF6F30A
MEVKCDVHYQQVVKHLRLQNYYPRKLTCERVFEVCKKEISPEELNDDPSKIPWYMLQNLMMCNYEGRCFELEESQGFHGTAFSLSSVLQDDETSLSNENSQVSPTDALVAILLCSDNFLRQILIEKLSTCQLAIPLLIPVTDVSNKEWELIVWGISTITKKWKTSSGSSCEKSMAVEKLPIVSALRLGRPKISKSKIINCVINEQKHDIFFNSGCKGGNLERKLSDGLLEMAWYLPTQKRTNAFSDALTFINLRGNASDFKRHTYFLSDISLVTIAFVSCTDFDKHDTGLLESLYIQRGHVIFILDGASGKELKDALYRMEKNIRDVKKQVHYVKASNKNELKISGEIWGLLGSNFEGDSNRNIVSDRSVEMCIEVAHRRNYHVDEMVQDCFEAKQSAKILLDRIIKEGKENELPMQMVTVKIGETRKEQHRLLRKGNMQIEEYVDRRKKEIVDLRSKQLDLHQNKCCTYQMFRAPFTNSLIKRKYFFGFVKIMTDRYSIKGLQPIREEYIRKWNELCDERKNEPNTLTASLNSMKDILNELEQQLSHNSLGLEHYNREIGQKYEMSAELKLSTHHSDNRHLARVAAEMLLHGYPIELMDGDATHVPLTWIEAVFTSLKDQIGNKKIFVLSVLGIQSSGKSTMLNAMFGLQFSVSAGRCTKGIFAQLVSLDRSLREDTQCDYILVVDTEGLRSPEFASQLGSNRDNELATLVIGLGDVTIINIMGENPTDMQDTLQIAVHAFMKMENVHIKPSCIFVHQNVTDVTASDLNTTQKRSMREMLDTITKIAAEAENCSERYKSFSDVINFQENKHIMYISSLWQGDPPMAPPNPGYSKCILQVKKQVLEFIKNSKPKSITDFTTLLSDLWRAILCQNFVFSFKNSLEIQAFNSLDAEYVKHARTFRRNALEYSDRLQSECKKLTTEKMREEGEQILDWYLKKLEDNIIAFRASMTSYFADDVKACQWQGKIELQLEDLCKEIIKEMKGVFTSIRNKVIGRAEIDANIEMHEREIYRKAKRLADVYRNKQLSDMDLEKEFANNWKTWVSNIPSSDDCVDIGRSFQKIAEENYLENNKAEVSLAFQSSETEVTEHDLHLRNWKKFKSYFSNASAKTYVNDANCTKQNIVEKLQKQISNHTLNGTNYTNQLGFDCFNSLSCDLKEIKLDGKSLLKSKAQIRLAVCNFKTSLIPSLKKMQEQYKHENDPRLYLESRKERLWQTFKDECTVRHIISKAASAISREIACAIKISLPDKCKLGVIDHLRYSSSKSFSSKMSLHASMLIAMAEKGNFDCFKEYLCNPILCIKNFTSEQIKKVCFETTKAGCSVLQEIYACEVHNIVSALNQAIATLNAKGDITLKSWWLTLLDYIDKVLCIKTDIRFFDEERDLALEEFSDKLLDELNGIKDKIIREYDSSIFSEISTSCCDFFTADLLACQEVCPFCKALCDLNGIHDHHRTDCHRPNGVAGYRWTDSTKLDSDLCTTAVMSNYRFINEDTNSTSINFRDYRTVNEHYASWKIEPLAGESEMFWKWFMATYNTELAEYYNAKEADIPAGWKRITMEQAKEDIKKLYNI